MTEHTQQYPPNPSRQFAAAKKGLFPQSELISLGLALIAAGITFYFLGPPLAEALISGIQSSLQATGSGEASLPSSFLFLLPSLLISATILSVILLSGSVGALLPAFRAKRSLGSTSSELPKMTQIRVTKIAIRILAFFLISLSWICQWHDALSDLLSLVREWRPNSPDGLTWIFRGIISTGLVLLAAGFLEMLALRASIWKSLHLSSLQQRREQQLQSGSPHVRARLQSQYKR